MEEVCHWGAGIAVLKKSHGIICALPSEDQYVNPALTNCNHQKP